MGVCNACSDDHAANAMRVRLIMPVDSKIVTVIFVQSVISGKPHIALFVLGNIEYCVLRQPLVDSDMNKVN